MPTEQRLQTLRTALKVDRVPSECGLLVRRWDQQYEGENLSSMIPLCSTCFDSYHSTWAVTVSFLLPSRALARPQAEPEGLLPKDRLRNPRRRACRDDGRRPITYGCPSGRTTHPSGATRGAAGGATRKRRLRRASILRGCFRTAVIGSRRLPCSCPGAGIRLVPRRRPAVH